MGVLWVKAGQLISIRRDFFPREVCDELAKLQDQADGFPCDVALSFVEQELGAPIHRYFREFDQVPFAAASISQIHKARLRQDNVSVCVKIQRPDIEQTFAKDMRLLKRLGRLLTRFSIMTHARWNDLLWEIEHVMREELDYRVEATNIRRMKKSLRSHGVYVPEVFGQYSTQRVLVMEYIDGVTMSDYLKTAQADPDALNRWLEHNHIQPRKVARRLVQSHLRQSLEDNLFHGDLHPGNILLLRRSRLAFVDFGSVGFLERDFLQKYDLYLEAMHRGQYAKMADIYMLFALNLPPTNLADLKEEFIQCLLDWETRRRVREFPYDQRSLGMINYEITKLFGKYGIALDWTFLRLIRAWFTMDVSLSILMPDADVRRMLSRFYRGRNQRLRRRVIRDFSTPSHALRQAMELPRLVFEQNIYRGAVVRRLAMIFEGTTSSVVQFTARAFSAVSGVFAIVGAVLLIVFLYQRGNTWIAPVIRGPMRDIFAQVPRLDFQVWMVVLMIVGFGWRSFRTLARRFRERDAQLPGT
jgi:ubiquinone biosynthesis protein